MNDQRFWNEIDALRERDGRYAREAYGFVMRGLGYALGRLPAERRNHPARRHLSGQELLAGLLDLAREEFGFLAYRVLSSWGVREGRDFGEVVFRLVEAGVLSKRPEDRIEDFEAAPDFRTMLEEEFPWSRLGPPSEAASPRRTELEPQPPGEEP